MSEKGAYFGEWTIGDANNTILNGNLIIDHNENIYKLTLYSHEPVLIPSSVEIIYGKTHEGSAYTCYNCIVGGTYSSSIIHGGIKYFYEVSFDYLLEGQTFTNPSEVLLKKVSFGVTNMDQWAFQEALKRELTEESNYILTTKNLEDVVHKNERFELIISYSTSPDYNYIFKRAETISTKVNMRIEFYNPTTIEETKKIINQVRDFIALCTTLPTYVTSMSAIPNYPEDHEMQIPISIYSIYLGIEKLLEEDLVLRRSDNYISLLQIKKDFDKCMKNWFAKNKKLKPVIELYLSIYYHRTSNERHFLNLIQALEAYHRLTRNNHVLSRDEHSTRINEILSGVPEVHKEWVKTKLNFSNEPSLHERLEDLLNPTLEFDDLDKQSKYELLFEFKNKEKEELIRNIKNTRNYNTHFSEHLLRKTVKGEELYQLVLFLKVLLEYYLLTELEIDKDTILDLCWGNSQQIRHRETLINAMTKGNA
ncbi:HEPN domain-containing protein [Bacillus atrophaeus]|uniref:HEPN domain-containing protein n=1 Tax=Bacillus atrophaeus TaxID=1452 RepID=UPI00240E864F|nr:HEPN domain-containing protein [Bacillus atrophaeus]